MKLKKIILGLGLAAAVATVAFGADASTFAGVDTVINEGVKSSQSAVGGGTLTFYGIFPLVVVFAGMILTGLHAYSKSESGNKSPINIIVWAIGGAIGGAVAGIVIVTMVGLFMFKNASAGYNLFSNYHKAGVEIHGGSTKETTFE